MGKRRNKGAAKSLCKMMPTPLKQAAPSNQTPSKPTPPPRRASKWLWSMIAAVGLFAGFAIFRPQLQISKSDPLYRSDPFRVRFEVKNEGVLLPVSHAQATCEFRELRFKNGIHMGKMGTRRFHPYFPSIAPGDSAPVACPVEEIFGTHLPALEFADVQIGVEYLYLWFLSLHYQARFVTKEKDDGSLIWVQQPVMK